MQKEMLLIQVHDTDYSSSAHPDGRQSVRKTILGYKFRGTSVLRIDAPVIDITAIQEQGCYATNAKPGRPIILG